MGTLTRHGVSFLTSSQSELTPSRPRQLRTLDPPTIRQAVHHHLHCPHHYIIHDLALFRLHTSLLNSYSSVNYTSTYSMGKGEYSYIIVD